jgi:hypothetical protein
MWEIEIHNTSIAHPGAVTAQQLMSDVNFHTPLTFSRPCICFYEFLTSVLVHPSPGKGVPIPWHCDNPAGIAEAVA